MVQKEDFPGWVHAALAGLPALVKEADVAKLLSVDQRTLRHWRADGRFKAVRTSPGGSGRVLVAKAEVGRLLASLAGAA